MSSLNKRTPGVYVEEISKFPPSIAEVATAIPAFIGYTQKAEKEGESLVYIPTRITSLLQYEKYFGTTPPETFRVGVDKDTSTSAITVLVTEKPQPKFLLYYAMQLFFENGGGPCYIISAGTYGTESPFDTAIKNGELETALNAAAEVDEVTLLVFPDANSLSSEIQHTGLIDKAMAQCEKLQDRFTIADVRASNDEIGEVNDNFRSNINSTLDKLKYGAAYYPYLETLLPFVYGDDSVTIDHYKENGAFKTAEVGLYWVAVKAWEDAITEKKLVEKIKMAIDAFADDGDKDDLKDQLAEKFGDKVPAKAKAALGDNTKTIADVKAEIALDLNDAIAEVGEKEGDKDDAKDAAEGKIEELKTADEEYVDVSFKIIEDIKGDYNGIYNAIIDKVDQQGVVLPPSSAMAGVYAYVDNTRGVWKAPANIGLMGVVKPTVKISNDFQDNLNVDATSGKSVNAIRAFTGKGTLVWGARTLAGNDNEWRYISVRRFFNMVEESTKKATEQFVFEPNNANTWVKVKAMIENFLVNQWRAGALVGAKQEHAFYVKVGLNETMTAEDILNGYMIVEIGMAVVRPAEFIILRFSHKMQES